MKNAKPPEKTFTCSYCGQTYPEAPPAHLFPDVLGGSVCSTLTVCHGCNNRVNSRVENPSLRFFAFLRSGYGIRGCSGKIPLVPGEVRLPDGSIVPVNFGPDGDIHGVIRAKVRREDGTAGLLIAGMPEQIESERARIDGGRRPLHWESGVWQQPVRPWVKLDEDVDHPTLRRLASKIAFERAAMLLGGETCAAPPFERLRRFVLDGTEGDPVCGVIGTDDVLAMSFGLGRHLVAISGQQGSLRAVVGLFGLLNYWVRLSTYPHSEDWDNALVDDPETRRVEEFARKGPALLPWDRWIEESTQTPEETRAEAFAIARARLELEIEEQWATRGKPR